MRRWFWLVAGLAFSGFFATRLVDALAISDQPDQWAHLLLYSISLAVALAALVAAWLGRRIPLLTSPNPFVNSLAWIALIGIQFIFIDLIYPPLTTPPALWVVLFAFAYGVSVLVQRILSSRNGPTVG